MNGVLNVFSSFISNSSIIGRFDLTVTLTRLLRSVDIRNKHKGAEGSVTNRVRKVLQNKCVCFLSDSCLSPAGTEDEPSLQSAPVLPRVAARSTQLRIHGSFEAGLQRICCYVVQCSLVADDW